MGVFGLDRPLEMALGGSMDELSERQFPEILSTRFAGFQFAVVIEATYLCILLLKIDRCGSWF